MRTRRTGRVPGPIAAAADDDARDAEATRILDDQEQEAVAASLERSAERQRRWYSLAFCILGGAVSVCLVRAGHTGDARVGIAGQIAVFASMVDAALNALGWRPGSTARVASHTAITILPAASRVAASVFAIAAAGMGAVAGMGGTHTNAGAAVSVARYGPLLWVLVVSYVLQSRSKQEVEVRRLRGFMYDCKKV